MADHNNLLDLNEEELAEILEEKRDKIISDELHDPILLVERVYQLCWHWADFELFIISPTIASNDPPLVIEPGIIASSGEEEFVYPIHDYGFKLKTSKGKEMFSAGMSMCKLYYTIEKMVFLLVERLKTGGINTETEVQVSFAGYELAQRKAFESIVNLPYNVIVSNFDPGLWGERFLETVKRLADKGYGYPKEAPREIYRQTGSASTKLKARG